MGFCNDTAPTARKVHNCLLCDRPIPVGEKHVKRVGKGDGDFSSFRMHTRCREVAHEEYSYDDWEMHDPSVFREILSTLGASK